MHAVKFLSAIPRYAVNAVQEVGKERILLGG
jgi:hypothetical protein